MTSPVDYLSNPAERVRIRIEDRIYAQVFERVNFNFRPILEEKVVVFLETSLDPQREDSLLAFDIAMMNALRQQYPSWVCPYSGGNPPPNAFEAARHGFSSVMPKGAPRLISSATEIR